MAALVAAGGPLARAVNAPFFKPPPDARSKRLRTTGERSDARDDEPPKEGALQA
jgi:hypothetical protein